MKWPRASGILLHPTSLPGPFGIGDLGPTAIRFLDFLAAGKQRLWQTLPLGPTGFGNSPYAMVSAFAGSPLLISPERLVEDGLLAPADIELHPDFPRERVDYCAVAPWKLTMLRMAHERFLSQTDAPLQTEYLAFRERQQSWLDDFALYAALKNAHEGAAWVEWEAPLANRNATALAEVRCHLAREVSFHTFTQFLFFRQWDAVHQAARARGISIVGDLAIFVAHDSADVWAHPELFQLDERGWPTVVAGVPPDYFSATGQRWGNPLYRWDVLQRTGYAWWIERVRHALALEDMIRLDHFRGFEAYWEVPASCPTAMEGRWMPGPGDALFDAIGAALGDVPFIAEDLGQITLEVHALRQRFQLPGMRVLQFAFSGDPGNTHLPHTYTHDATVYTGTHDNDTTRGWFESAGEHERAQVLQYLACEPEQVVWKLIRTALASVADLAIVPLQDVLELGTHARMNVPARPDANWEWRCLAEQLTPEVSARLASLTTLYGR